MACVSGTNIVNDGLVFHFDLENGVKSFKGKPTTNLIANPTFTTGTYSPWSYQQTAYGNSVVDTTTTLDGYNSVKITRTQLTGETNLWTNLSSLHSLQPNTEYTFSVYALANKPNEAAIFSYFGTSSEGFVYHTGSGEWERLTHTFTTRSTEPYIQLRMWHDAVTLDSPVWFTKIQVEETNIASKWINGTRLDTASIVDVSPTKSTITAANLTYRQDDTPTFDGTNDYLSIPQPNVQTSPNIWTIEGWIKTGNQTSFFITPNSNGIDNFLRYDAGQQQIVMTVCSAADTNGRGFPTGAGSVPHNTWTHFSASIDNLDVKMHINGELKYSGTETISMSGWTGIWRIGQRGNGTNYLLGELDNLKVYTKALTATEIKQNFEAARSRYGI